MLNWPPPPITATCANPQPQPFGTALRRALDWAYLTRTQDFWHKPPHERAAELLRAVMQASRSFSMPCKGLDYMAADPITHWDEYEFLALLANADPTDAITAMTQNWPDDPFPIARLDPAERRGRWP